MRRSGVVPSDEQTPNDEQTPSDEPSDEQINDPDQHVATSRGEAPSPGAGFSPAATAIARAPGAPWTRLDLGHQQGDASPPRPPVTRLAEQSRLLDEARLAEPERGLELVALFHASHPSSPLAPDAEMVALRALLAQGERQALRIRARSFLVAYPNDPHAARVEPWAKP